MKFLYNPRKAAQAATYLVRLGGGQMDVYALIKILYLSDRRALSQRGRPITGDAMVSMPYGPVLSRIYDDSKSPEAIQSEFWRESFAARENNVVCLRQPDPPTDELSQYERDLLNDAHENYGHYDFSQLRRIVDQLPEYRDPQGSSLPIDPVTILREEGWSDEEIEEARMSAREELILGTLEEQPLKVRT
jgi:uncharacterized phage-associated protein